MTKPKSWDYAAVDELAEAHDLDLSVNQYEAIALAVHRIGPGLFPKTPLYRHLAALDFDGAHEALVELARNATGAVKEDFEDAAGLFVCEVYPIPPRQPDDPGVEPEPEELGARPRPSPGQADPLSMGLIVAGFAVIVGGALAWIFG